jgi:FixJ family two-component response regulator
MDTRNLKNNFCLTSHNEMLDICKPLIDYTEIDYVIYGRFYEDNSIPSKNNINCKYEKLTAREKESAFWLFNGKTIPEIALILNISKRTVEKFITSIKNKFDCCTLFQLGNELSIIRDKLMLMEKLN